MAASKQNEAENLSNLGRTMNKVEAFVRRHPRVYFRYMTFVVFVMGLLAKYLNSTMLHFILMKGLNPNPPPPPPPPPPPEPKVERKQIQIPYVPAWVAASFRDPTKHPLFKGPFPAVEVKDEDILEVTETPVEPVAAVEPTTPVTATEELFVTKSESSEDNLESL